MTRPSAEVVRSTLHSVEGWLSEEAHRYSVAADGCGADLVDVMRERARGYSRAAGDLRSWIFGGEPPPNLTPGVFEDGKAGTG